MGLSLRQLSVSALVTSALIYYYLVLDRRTPYFLNQPLFYVLYVAVWTLHVAANMFYGIIIWPKYLSPLRHLPEPTEGRSWWNGYGKKAFLGAKGEPIAQW